MTRGKMSLARSIHGCPNFLIPFPDQFLYIVKNTCVYTHVSDCVEILYELPLPPNNTASETFLQRPGAVRIVECIFLILAPAWR